MFQELEEFEKNYSRDAKYVGVCMPLLPLLSVKEVAAAIGQSDQYVRDLVNDGTLRTSPSKSTKRKNVKIYRLSVLDYLERKKRK